MSTAINREDTFTNPYSIRWRLLLSYAGIALLTAVALGGLLLFTLRSYYDQRERDYMNFNGQAIARSAEQLLYDETPDNILESAAHIYSFVTLARVRLLDVNHEVIVDSGSMNDMDIVQLEYRKPQTGVVTGEIARPADNSYVPPDTRPESFLSIQGEAFIKPTDTEPEPNWRLYEIGSRRSALDKLISGETDPESRTNLVVTVPLYDHRSNEVIGYLEISEGPAFGTEIVNDVAEKAVVAGLIAMLLAGVVGWFTSQRISRPVLALSETTVRMAEGDLSVRANVNRRDEFGLLAHTFNTMAERVENTVVTLKRFVADAAHEINTPITALRTNLELAATSGQPDQFRADIAHAQTELARLEMLTHGLLLLARIEARSNGTTQQTVDLTALIRQMHERYASRAEQANITLQIEAQPEPVLIAAKEALLTRVLENLLDNALKFTPELGTVTLGLQTETNKIRLWVADTGIGIPVDDVPKLFSRFYRASNVSAYPGNGLGLAITKAIVEDHGGTIKVESSVESAAKHTCFEVRLPRQLEGTS